MRSDCRVASRPRHHRSRAGRADGGSLDARRLGRGRAPRPAGHQPDRHCRRASHAPAEAVALSAVDAFLRSGKADRWALRAASAAYEGRPGYRQAQDILRYADRRSASPGESWLRFRLLDAGFGQPELQIPVTGPDRSYRLDLGYPDRPVDGRRLVLEYDSDQWHSSAKQQHRDEARRTELDALGWHIISVRRPDLWGSYPALGDR